MTLNAVARHNLMNAMDIELSTDISFKDLVALAESQLVVEDELTTQGLTPMNTQQLLGKLDKLLVENTTMTYVEIQLVLNSLRIMIKDHIDNTYIQGRNDGYDSGFDTCLSLCTNN